MNSTDNSRIKILFLASDPSDATRLRLGQELRDIREKLQLSKNRDRFILESRESVRPGDITQAIFDVEPSIIHFSGHGSNKGELCFEDSFGDFHTVKASTLSQLFKPISERIKINCVVLDACYSEIQAEEISKHIPCVIGINNAIEDKAAVAFVTGFYDAFEAGFSIKKAYGFGRAAIRLESIEESSPVPVLYLRKLEEVPKEDITLPPNKSSVSTSFLKTAQSLKLEGHPDWSENIDQYLYGEIVSDNE